jgi:hypothetical protein
MSDRYVEVTSQGWFSRIISSIVGMLAGVVMFIAGFPVLWWNEGRAVTTARSLEEGAGAVVSVSPDRIDPTNEGKLVHLSGLATTSEILLDPVFKISANALHLRREVEMYQWVEHQSTQKRERLGGSEETVTTYSYEREWKSALVNSSRFKKPEGHLNPGSMRYTSARYSASHVTLGAFTLGAGLTDRISDHQPVPATEQALAAMAAPATGQAPPPPPARKGRKAKVARKVPPPAPARVPGLQLSGDSFYAGADPAAPAVGDTRISFTRVPPSQVSIIAQQRGTTFQPYQTKAGNALSMLSQGTVGAAQMFSEAERNNTVITWLLRVAGYLLMAFGGFAVLRPLAVTASVIPFLGTLARTGLGLVAAAVAAPFAFLTIAIAWIVYRPLLGILLLAGAAAAFLLVKLLAGRSSRAAAPVPVAAAG